MKKLMEAIVENRKVILKGVLGLAGSIAATVIANAVFKDDDEKEPFDEEAEKEPIDITDNVTEL